MMKAGSSSRPHHVLNIDNEPNKPSVDVSQIIEKLPPIPKCKKRCENNSVSKRKSEKSCIITSSPFKQQLQARKTLNMAKKLKLSNANIKPKKNPKKLNKNLATLSSDSGQDDCNCIYCNELYEL